MTSRGGFFRAHPRFEVRLRVLVTHVEAGWQRYAPAQNVGLGGARLLLDERLSSGDAVTLSFTAPTLWDPLVLRGRVVWLASSIASEAEQQRRDPHYLVGVAFDHRSAEAVLGLHELIGTMAYE